MYYLFVYPFSPPPLQGHTSVEEAVLGLTLEPEVPYLLAPCVGTQGEEGVWVCGVFISWGEVSGGRCTSGPDAVKVQGMPWCCRHVGLWKPICLALGEVQAPEVLHLLC